MTHVYAVVTKCLIFSQITSHQIPVFLRANHVRSITEHHPEFLWTRVKSNLTKPREQSWSVHPRIKCMWIKSRCATITAKSFENCFSLSLFVSHYFTDRDQSTTDTNKIKIKIAVVFKCFLLSVLFEYYFLSPREVVVVLSHGNVRISLVTQRYAAV